MAFSSRLVAKSRQFYAGQAILQTERVIPVRQFCKKALIPEDKGDKMLKDIFLDIVRKYKAALSVLRKEKITIDPDDPSAVAQYAHVMKLVREKAGFLSEAEKIRQTKAAMTKGVQDYRTYISKLKEARIKLGITDDLGSEAMMLEALERVEKALKKPLLMSDEKGMALMNAEIAKIHKKLGIRKEDLPKYEEELELGIAKADLIDLKKEVVDAMATVLKREEFKDEEMVDPKTLDIRNVI